MPRFRNPAFFCLLFVFACSSTHAEGEKKKPDAAPAKALDPDAQAGKINIAIPLRQPVKGIHLPFYDLNGTLKMQFDAETANRTSNDVVEMTVLQVETFDEKGKSEMLVKFPSAVFDIASSVIKSEENVEVRRKDFVLTGKGMNFDTKKRAGRVFSNIRMEIFNRSADTPSSTPTPNGP